MISQVLGRGDLNVKQIENDYLCYCGSGRRFKNCCSKKKIKERYQRVKFNFGNVLTKRAKIVIYSDETTELGLKLIDENFEEVEVTMYEIEGYYEKENKSDKIIYRLPIIDNQYIKDINIELIKYDAILTIDTSYELIANTKIAFTSIMIFTKVSDDNNYIYQQVPTVLKWDATMVDKPENLMYAHVIENIRLHNIKHNQNPKMAVIIDSDLENISFFNDRTKPIYEDYYLPEQFYLFYASSDTGSENLQNKLFKMCDNEAKKALQRYKNERTEQIKL